MRGQLSLPALGVALLVLTGATLVGVTVAGGAVSTADRRALDRQAAVALSERLTAPTGQLTVRENVLNATRLGRLTDDRLRERYGVTDGASARVAVDGRTVATAGTVGDGVTVERLVLVAEREPRTLRPAFTAGPTVTLPRRTGRVRVRLQPPADVTVTRVWAGGRVVLADPTGLRGTYTVAVSRGETVGLRFDASDRLSRGSVRLTYYPTRTRKARLEVTVDGQG